MRVLHVVRQFWPAVGGLENFVLDLASEQIRTGIEAQVLTLNRLNTKPHEVLKARDEIRGIRVRRIGYLGSRRYPLAVGALRHLRSFDLIHVHAVDFFCDYLAATAPIHGKPLVLSTHGGFFHTHRNRRLKQLFFSAATRRTLKRFQAVIASSVGDEALFKKIAEGKVRRIDNGVNTQKFAHAASPDFKPSLIYFGRFASNKGIEALIASFAALKRHVPEARLYIAGNDYDGLLEGMRAQVRDEGLDGSVAIHTALDDDGLREKIGLCSFFVSAARYEGFGLSLVEAMSAGLVPIVSRIPSFEEITSSSGVGKTMDFDEPESAAAEMARYIRQIGNRHCEARTSAVMVSEGWNWTRVAKRFRECYEQVLGARKRQILGVEIEVLKRGDAIDLIQSASASGKRPLKVAFANANTLNLAAADPAYKSTLREFLMLNDGVGMDLASLMKFGQPFPENLNGTDFVPDFLSSVPKPLRVYLIGSSSHVVEAAAHRFGEWWPRHSIVGFRSGFFGDRREVETACAGIRANSPDVVLVGMGNPLQELWISQNAEATGARLLFAVGALFDFAAGAVSRAPLWVRRAHCEWLYRFAQEPRRLAWRYLIGNPQFLIRVYRDKFKLEAL